MKLDIKVNEERGIIVYSLYGDGTYIIDVFDEAMEENIKQLILLIKDYTPHYIYFIRATDDSVEGILLRLASNGISIDQELNKVSYGY